MLAFACVLNILVRTLEEKIKENDKKRTANLLLENYVNNPLKVSFFLSRLFCVCVTLLKQQANEVSISSSSNTQFTAHILFILNFKIKKSDKTMCTKEGRSQVCDFQDS